MKTYCLTACFFACMLDLEFSTAVPGAPVQHANDADALINDNGQFG
jgi:hypothetical protein